MFFNVKLILSFSCVCVCVVCVGVCIDGKVIIRFRNNIYSRVECGDILKCIYGLLQFIIYFIHWWIHTSALQFTICVSLSTSVLLSCRVLLYRVFALEPFFLLLYIQHIRLLLISLRLITTLFHTSCVTLCRSNISSESCLFSCLFHFSFFSHMNFVLFQNFIPSASTHTTNYMIRSVCFFHFIFIRCHVIVSIADWGIGDGGGDGDDGDDDGGSSSGGGGGDDD